MKTTPTKLDPKIWLLRLVLPGRYGRWVTAILTFSVAFAIFWFGGILSGSPAEIAVENKSAALFFCVIVAYLIPTFHYVSERTEIAIEALESELDTAHLSEPLSGPLLRDQITRRSWGWQLTNLLGSLLFWLIQSWFLAGGLSGMRYSLTSGIESALMALGALPVWIVVSLVIQALINNAHLFRELARAVPVDVLHTKGLMAFGRMAVSAVLVVVGTQASFSIMFFGGVDTPWAWGPGLLLTSAAMGYLLLGPVLPLHRRLKLAKAESLNQLESEIRATGGLDKLSDPEQRRALSELLVVREELRRLPEWPFDMDLLARLGIYLIIVPLTWVGAALIENVVNLVIG